MLAPGSVVASDPVGLQVDEARSDPFARLGGHLLVRGTRWTAGANPRDQAVLDEDPIDGAIHPVHAPAEERAHDRVLSPSATARSPCAADNRTRAARASRLRRSIRIASFAFPPASCRAAFTFSSE